MILEVRAEYCAATDNVEVVAIVQENSGVSAADQVELGVVQLLQGPNAQYTTTFTSQDVVLAESDGAYSDVGQFHIYILHPTIQMNMKAKCTITLYDGRTAQRQVPVEYNMIGSQMPTTNPSLGGIENPTFPMDPDKP